mmetsp:Transcript_24543/g.24139  ORF Transcript_24543/g.24139 Transcript_24543/m.24139 type:complete len:280 (+) Transcript_24543:805-1644(+)
MLEGTNFDQYYKGRKGGGGKEKSENLNRGVTQEFNCIKKIETIYNKRHLNFSIVLTDQEINPNTIMKFDVRQINDVVSLRKSSDPKHCWLIFACHDGFLKVFSLKEYKIVATMKGTYGNPLCIEISQDQNIMVAGFEDDSFVAYSLKKGLFTPLIRGTGHKSFIAQIKIDPFYHQEFQKQLLEERKKEQENSPNKNKSKEEGKEEKGQPESRQSIIQKIKLNRKKSMMTKFDEARKDSKSKSDSFLDDDADIEYRIITGAEDGTVYFWNFEFKDHDSGF